MDLCLASVQTTIKNKIIKAIKKITLFEDYLKAQFEISHNVNLILFNRNINFK